MPTTALIMTSEANVKSQTLFKNHGNRNFFKRDTEIMSDHQEVANKSPISPITLNYQRKNLNLQEFKDQEKVFSKQVEAVNDIIETT